jgi:hypothetical protein
MEIRCNNIDRRPTSRWLLITVSDCRKSGNKVIRSKKENILGSYWAPSRSHKFMYVVQINIYCALICWIQKVTWKPWAKSNWTTSAPIFFIMLLVPVLFEKHFKAPSNVESSVKPFDRRVQVEGCNFALKKGHEVIKSYWLSTKRVSLFARKKIYCWRKWTIFKQSSCWLP